MKRLTFISILLLLVAQSFAFDKSLVCDFDQAKYMKIVKEPVKSAGKLYYQGECMSMIYSQPEGEYFKISDTKIQMLTGKSNVNKPLKGDSQFKQLRDLLILSMKGDLKTLQEQTASNIEHKTEGNLEKYVLTSKEKIQKGYNKIVLNYNKTNGALEYMELHQPNGNYTTYTLKNIKIGAVIPSGVF